MASVMLAGAIDYRARVSRNPVMDGDRQDGYLTPDPAEIVIRLSSLDNMRDSALHEVLHGILSSSDMDERLKMFDGDKPEEQGKLEEGIVKALTTGLLATFRHTRWTHRGRLLLPTYGEEK